MVSSAKIVVRFISGDDVGGPQQCYFIAKNEIWNEKVR